MIRCSDLCLLAAVLLSTPVKAEGLVSDAFGLFDPETDRSGRKSWAGLQGLADQVIPGAPDHILIYAGPKTLAAGSDQGQIAALVIDSAGNAVADGSQITLTIHGAKTEVLTRGGIGSEVFLPAPVAGDILLGADTGGRQSLRATITVMTDIGAITPRLDGPLPVADPETVFQISTPHLSDANGNALPDGTGTSLLLRHANGSYSLAFGLALQDRVMTEFIARDISGAASATLILGGEQSASKDLTISTFTAPLPPEIALEELNDILALRVTVGPFVTNQGYVLTDGARVDLSVRLLDGSEINEALWLLDGEASLLLPIASASDVSSVIVTSPLGTMDLTESWLSSAKRFSEKPEDAE